MVLKWSVITAHFADDILQNQTLAEGVNLPAAGTATSQDVMPDYIAKLASESQPLMAHSYGIQAMGQLVLLYQN